jgi:NADH-quinone oxidoreductase subunit N
VSGALSVWILEALAVTGASVLLLADLFTPAERKGRIGGIATVITAVLALVAWFGIGTPEAPVSTFGGSLVLDPMALFLKRTFAIGGLLAVLVCRRYEDRLNRGLGEFYFLLLAALSGMFLVSSVGDFTGLFVCLELVTLSFCIMSAFHRDNAKSVEAGLKLLVLGALSASFVLLGIAFVYGAVGDLGFAELRAHVLALHGTTPSAELVFGLLLVFLGLGFKIGMMPMQIWVPDVYEGAPTPTTAFLSVGSKTAGFALVLRLAATVAGPGTKPSLQLLFGAAAFATLFYGNLAAIPQTNIKRLMGYSSIGHCGYLLLGLVALGPAQAYDGGTAAAGTAAILFYLLAYALTNMSAFLVITVFSGASGSDDLDSYAGLARRSPILAASLTVALLSLAGVPPLAGFFGKFMLLRAVALNGPAGFWLLAAAGLNVVIGLYYYLCVIKRMYMQDAEDESSITVAPGTRALLYTLTVAMIGIGLFPGPVVTMATDAARLAFGG